MNILEILGCLFILQIIAMAIGLYLTSGDTEIKYKDKI